MHFVIYTIADKKEKVLIRWDEQQILEATEERLGKEKAKVLMEIMTEFKKETIKLP